VPVVPENGVRCLPRNFAARDNMAARVRVCAIIDLRSSRHHPLGDAVETFVRREDAERFVGRCAATIPSWRATCGSRRASWRGGVN
jgi:hypothetical protein